MCVLKCVQFFSRSAHGIHSLSSVARHWSRYAKPFQIRLSHAGGFAGGADGGGGEGGAPGGGGDGGVSGPGLFGGGVDGGDGGNGGGEGITLQRASSTL